MRAKGGFSVEIGNEDLVTPGGLEFLGMALRATKLRSEVDRIMPIVSKKGIKTNDCVAAMIGLLCQGKTAFEAVEEMRENPVFSHRARKYESPVRRVAAYATG